MLFNTKRTDALCVPISTTLGQKIYDLLQFVMWMKQIYPNNDCYLFVQLKNE